jgi:uncharacterized membrane protein
MTQKEEIVMTTEPLETFDPEDIEKNKTIAGLAYFIFFLPLVACPDSRFGKFHANQALVLLLFCFGASIAIMILSVVLGFIPFVGWAIVGILWLAFCLLAMVLVVIGLLNGLNGNAKELPVIGQLRLLK